jgi:uncharacterized membrane protein YdfJ with MMPL/SSD domain
MGRSPARPSFLLVRPSSFNALSVGLGFGVLALSAFRPLTYMGILIGITMFTASFAAMTLLPALLGVLKPKFMKKPCFSRQEKPLSRLKVTH